jgi:glycosyltransferase involved in cell wall biosynthesis
VKRADLLIDAFNAIAERRPDWDLLIIGDGTLRDELQARVRGGLADRVIWAGYMSKAAEIAAVMRCSDVLVLPSEQEPWGVVVNEAAAAGLALVCSDVVGAAAELLRDGVNGRSFPVCDLEALKTALLDVTDADHIARYRSQSPTVLHEWQIRGDPIAGLVQALRAVKVLH